MRRFLFIVGICLAFVVGATATSADARPRSAGAASPSLAAQGFHGMAALSEPSAPVAEEPVRSDETLSPTVEEVVDEVDLPLDEERADPSGPAAPSLPSGPSTPQLPGGPAPAPAPGTPMPDVAERWAPAGLLAIAAAAGLAPVAARRGLFGSRHRPDPPRLQPGGNPIEAADALIQAGQTRQAAAILRRTVTGRPTDGEARYSLGVALAMDGNVREALREFEYAIRLNDVFLGLMVKDPTLTGFVGRPDVYRFIRTHARAFHERVHRAYV